MQTDGKIHKQTSQYKNFNSQQLQLVKQPSNQSQSASAQFQLQNLRNNPELIPENQVFKGCNCKKSKCMKMYCECFYFGSRCSDICKCIGCLNGPLSNNLNHAHNQVNLSSNINNSKQNFEELFENRKNKILSKGCNCKKSGCQKKYCQCFNIGAVCHALCKCQQCKNIVADDFVENIQNQIQSLSKKEQKIRQKQYEYKAKQQKNNQIQQQIVQKIQKNEQFSQKLKNLLSNIQPIYQQSILQYLHYMLS